jgi:proteasome beta subunit
VTVVLAARCAEGLVLGADSQATDVSGGNIAFAVKQTTQKLFAVGQSSIAWGGTGSGGLIQKFQHTLEQLSAVELAKPIEELRATLAGLQRQHQTQAQTDTNPNFGQVPQISPLFAGYTDGRPWILEVTVSGEDTVYDEYYAVGSAGTFALQAMVSVAHYDITRRNLAEAQVIVWRALDGCIDTAAWGIGRPISLCVVTPSGARLLSTDDLRGVEDSVNLWKSEEREALGRLGLEGLASMAPEVEPAEEDEGIELEPAEEGNALSGRETHGRNGH